MCIPENYQNLYSDLEICHCNLLQLLQFNSKQCTICCIQRNVNIEHMCTVFRFSVIVKLQTTSNRKIIQSIQGHRHLHEMTGFWKRENGNLN